MKGSRRLRLVAGAAMGILVGDVAWSAEQGDSPKVLRRATPWLTEILVAELPKFVPPPSEETAVASESTEAAVERNGVLNLPKLTVRPVMKESPADYAFLTAKGRMDLAVKNHPGLRIGNVLGLNNGIAVYMQMEEQEVRAKAALTERFERSTLEDSSESRESLRLLKAALQRSSSECLSGRTKP